MRILDKKQFQFWLHVAVFLAGCTALAAYSVHIGMARSWDMRNYHYYNAYAFIEDRLDYDYAPAQIQTYLNPVSFVPFFLSAKYLGPKATGLWMGGFQGLAVGLIGRSSPVRRAFCQR